MTTLYNITRVDQYTHCEKRYYCMSQEVYKKSEVLC